MTYMILDSSGNAIASYTDAVSARAALRSIVEQEPEAADHVLLIAYNEQGEPVGEAMMVSDLPPNTTAVDASPFIMIGVSQAVIGFTLSRHIRTSGPTPWRPMIDVPDRDDEVAAAHGG